jgi:excisionase family DNA binding protein
MPRATIGEPLPLSVVRERATLNITEAAAILGVAKSTTYRMAMQGDLPVVRFGGSVRVNAQALLELLGVDN